MTSNTIGASDLGCMFDGVHGQAYNDTRLIALAVGYGYESYSAGEDSPEHAEDAADALDYINDTVCDAGYVLEWVDGDLLVVEHRQANGAVVSISSESLDTVSECDGELDLSAYALTCVRVAFPDSENGDDRNGPQTFDWLNRIRLDFRADEYSEQVSVYASTGDPRGAMRIATLTRRPDGSITLEATSHYYVTQHEHYAKPAGEDTVPAMWRIR